MKIVNDLTSACRYCRFYQPQGRRGGMCKQLGVSVKAEWKSCNLASPPFASDWENLEEIVWLEKSFSLECTTSETSVSETTVV